MASIFTFDPDPPRVSSPWLVAGATENGVVHSPADNTLLGDESRLAVSSAVQQTVGLCAEPQTGPTEYKLHLLLRPRRAFSFISTTIEVTGSFGPKVAPSALQDGLGVTSKSSPAHLATLRSRQHRLEQLTTQLLWRLQQSSSYHAIATRATVNPGPSDNASLLQSSGEIGKLVPGLEDSRGALYEIGVSDSGALVGLAEDELEESLLNLRAMAASLGCVVEVLRTVVVGKCEWIQHVDSTDGHTEEIRSSDLWVAEAFVKPYADSGQFSVHRGLADKTNAEYARPYPPGMKASKPAIPQLRISLAGASGSGKSSILGTLSTGTLDNGRGKSRLSLLKHRHEVVSGMTSSLVQELLGYSTVKDEQDEASVTRVINFKLENVSSWIDIHAMTTSRLVLLCDTAGHARYRRTFIRSLMGWAPHWTLVCVPADGSTASGGPTTLSARSSDVDDGAEDFVVDSSMRHLDICLNLGRPVVIVMTKLDLTSKVRLKQTLTLILSRVKQADRKPILLSAKSSSSEQSDSDVISDQEMQALHVALLSSDGFDINSVPIVFTSAVQGTGIPTLHALMSQLPCSSAAGMSNISSSVLYHIEDVFQRSAHAQATGSPGMGNADIEMPHHRFVLGGYLKNGSISMGEELLLGPFPSTDGSANPATTSDGTVSSSYPGASAQHHKSTVPEWIRVRVSSLRTLRRPARTLVADQLGTIGIAAADTADSSLLDILRIRKGMVLLSCPEPDEPFTSISWPPRGSKGCAVRLAAANAYSSLHVGTEVMVYFASVRASARVSALSSSSGVDTSVALRRHSGDGDQNGRGGRPSFSCVADVDQARNNDDQSADDDNDAAATLLVTLSFIGSREYVEIGMQILVMFSGGNFSSDGDQKGGASGLTHVVGSIVEAFV